MLLFSILTTALLIAALVLIAIRKIPKKAVLPLLAGTMLLRLAAAFPMLAGTGLLRQVTELL